LKPEGQLKVYDWRGSCGRDGRRRRSTQHLHPSEVKVGDDDVEELYREVVFTPSAPAKRQGRRLLVSKYDAAKIVAAQQTSTTDQQRNATSDGSKVSRGWDLD